MPSRFDPPPDPKPQPPEMLPLDLTTRYDVYCALHGQPAIVYRDVLLKRERSLFGRGDPFDRVSYFVELELPDGSFVFVSRISIIAFRQAGTAPGYESPTA
jgi:hypothetical protein